MIMIRAAAAGDAEAIAAIYNEGIRGRGATFETAERGPDDILGWLDSPDALRYPFIVAAKDDGTVVGWARTSSYRPRACYATIGEFSIYVAGSARGRRVGDALMAELVLRCERAGLSKILSRIFPENAASRALCARHGFREVGIYEKHGNLDGAWRDVIIVERLFPSAMGLAPGPA